MSSDCTPAHTVYGGDLPSIDCHPHHLAYTGLNLLPEILIGLILIALGILLAIQMRKYRDV